MTVAATGLSARRDHPWTMWLAVSLTGLLALRIAALSWNVTDLFFDEAQYWTWSLEPAFGYYSKPPLIAWAIGLATSVCGMGESCVRLPAPLFHTATAFGIYLAASVLYDRPVGFWAALAYGTLPAVSLSSGIISTDVPLLTFWAFAIWGLAALWRTDKWWPALALGVSLGLGLNSKYAMAYFVLCLGLYLLATPERRSILRDPRLWTAMAIGVLLIVPNLIWNARNGFATFSHTADNAKWTGSLLHPDKMLEFFGSQFGVFGPVLFAVLLIIAWRAWKARLPEPDRLLLALCLPIITIVTLQAFLSRAHANWAAPAYVSATILVVATMLREGARGWLRGSFIIHAIVLAVMTASVAFAGRFELPRGVDPFRRTMGWRDVASAARAELDAARARGEPYGSVITDERSLTAELLYYLQGERTPVLAYWDGGKPQDHYELTRPFTAKAPGPVLLVAIRDDWRRRVAPKFADVREIGRRTLKAGAGQRRIDLVRLERYKD